VILACILLAIYLIITLVTPRLLSSRRLLVRQPMLLLRLWLGALALASVSLLIALGIFIARALQHHVTHVAGHDIAGPLVDEILGWLSIAFIGLIAFRLGVAAQESRNTYREVSTLLAPVIVDAKPRNVGPHTIWVVDTPQVLVVALPHARRVVASTALLERLTDSELRAVVEHETSHLAHHHERILAIGSLAEAVAPAFLAGSRLAQSTRIATELIADDDAARNTSSEVLASALASAYPDQPGISERIQRLRSR
jgi:Zn-dependent protease with chaperone function